MKMTRLHRTFIQALPGATMCTIGARNSAYRARPGTPIAISIDESRLYLFDDGSGRAIAEA